MPHTCKKENKAPETVQMPADANAMFLLGIGFSTGSDGDQDLVAAHKWFNLAAMLGHDGALEARAELAREMTAEQVAEAQRQARAWLWTRDASTQAAADAKADTVRPIYVRRRAQALRSASSFSRVVGA